MKIKGGTWNAALRAMRTVEARTIRAAHEAAGHGGEPWSCRPCLDSVPRTGSVDDVRRFIAESSDEYLLSFRTIGRGTLSKLRDWAGGPMMPRCNVVGEAEYIA